MENCFRLVGEKIFFYWKKKQNQSFELTMLIISFSVLCFFSCAGLSKRSVDNNKIVLVRYGRMKKKTGKKGTTMDNNNKSMGGGGGEQMMEISKHFEQPIFRSPIHHECHVFELKLRDFSIKKNYENEIFHLFFIKKNFCSNWFVLRSVIIPCSVRNGII